MSWLNPLLRNRSAFTTSRCLLGVIFLVSALGKIVDPAAFADNVASYRLLPFAVVNVFSIVMTWTEFLVGLSLLNGVATRSSALLAAAMNIVFIGAAISAMARGLDIECGCFTVAKSTVGWGLIGRDVVFLALAFLVFYHRTDKEPAAEPAPNVREREAVATS